jgi:hypothetical protein
VEPTREQQPAVAEPAARAVVVGPGSVSPAQAQILMLQRHAGNAAVGRLLRSRRLLQRDDLDQAPVPLDGKKEAGAGDRFDSLDPSNAASSPAGVLGKINPAAPAFTKYPCTQNCPAAASAAQAYLLTGALPSSACSPLNEPKGYEISPGPESWAATGKGWADAWKGIQGVTGTMNAHGHRVAVDAFLGEVDADVGRYVGRLGAKSYSYTSERVTAKPVRP